MTGGTLRDSGAKSVGHRGGHEKQQEEEEAKEEVDEEQI